MKTLRFVATCIITVTLFTLCAVLTPQTAEMVGRYKSGGLGPGTLPAMCLIGITACMVYVFFSELRLYLASRAAPGTAPKTAADAPSPFGIPLRDFLVRSAIGIMLLWGYVIVWHYTTFFVGTLAFTVSLSLVILARQDRTRKKIFQTCIVLALFTGGAWFVFARLLKVPLR